MKLLADKDERFKGLFVKVSLFVLLALLGVMLNLVISGIKKGLFTPKSEIHFAADSGQDIKVGMPVKLSGFKIGSVSNLELDDKAHAQVTMLIEDKYLAMLREDAEVSLKKEGVIGDSILEAQRGSDDRKSLRAGAMISFERGGGLDQIAQDLRDRLYPALDEINKLLKDANDPKGDVRQTLSNLRQFSAEMRGTRARVDHLLDQVNEGVASDVRPALHAVKQSAEDTAAMVNKLNQELPALISKTDATIDNLRQTSATIKSAVDNSAPQISGLLGESRGLVSDTRTILDSASTNWPLKNMMQPPEQGLVKMDSHD
ncbi:MAG TPA: MlaD family protein [Gallionellaceae bacterium]|nr:MlaD family protein [Gallionellaceae bacterium]